MQRRIRSGALLAIIVALAACTSDPLPDITTDTIATSIADDGANAVPQDASLGSLIGTTWVLTDAFNVAPAYQPDALTFYRINEENRLEVNSACGSATSTFVEIPDAIRIDRPVFGAGNRCLQQDVFFQGDLETDIDRLGHLTLRDRGSRVDRFLRFTHVQSTSIQTDVVPERRVGEDVAFQIGRSRWNVVAAEGAAVSDDDLEQIIAFTTVSTNADVLSFYTGCRGVNKEVDWQDDGSILVGGPFQFLTPSIETPPCLDQRQGIADTFLIAGTIIGAELVDDDTLILSGVAREESWSATAVREVVPTGTIPSDCVDFRLGSVLEETYGATEVLPDGTETSVTLDGFDVVQFEALGGDIDGDGEWNPIQSFTLRDRSSDVQVDVLHVCGLDEPVADFVRIHPNRIVDVGRSVEGSSMHIWSSNGTQYSQNLHSIIEGPWTVLEGASYDLTDSVYFGPVSLTFKPLSVDTPGDLVNGVISVRSGCISLRDRGGGSPGLVFPADRTTWDPVNEAVIVDGVSYVDGERIGITRLPRPEFLDYFNPMERERCGISTHVIAEIWHLGEASE